MLSSPRLELRGVKMACMCEHIVLFIWFPYHKLMLCPTTRTGTC
uniref:Uncharacterized protein n=1 Tax=Anguilla anguilla TaxID=7936 RepID=A0A0E9RBX8_ANGAN